jgi:hypothetical protein
VPRSVHKRKQFRELIEIEKTKILVERAKLPTKEELAAVEKFGTDVNRFFAIHRKINDFVARVDPDSDRVFERMHAQFEYAMRAHEKSKHHEIELQTDLGSMMEKVLQLSDRISDLDGNKAMNLTSTKTTLEASIVDLEATLNSLHRKNAAK